jgi:hypothetical protein
LEAVVPLVAYRGLLPKAAFANDDCNAARARRGGASMVRRIFRIPGGDNARWNMSDDAHTLARQRMVATIAAETIFACASIGKAALAERVLGPSIIAVADLEPDLRMLAAAQTLARGMRELLDDLHAVDVRRELGEHRGLVTEPRSYLEHPIVRLDVQEVGHQRHDERL